METRTYARTDLIAIKIPKSRIIIKTLDIFLAEHLKSLSFPHQSYPFIQYLQAIRRGQGEDLEMAEGVKVIISFKI